MALELGAGTWLAVAALAGLAGMDDASWPQAMVSRPVVAATAGGWLLGDPAAGFLAGAVLELLTLRHLPFGGARCPDPGPASVVAGAAHAGAGAGGIAGLLAAVLVGWGLGWIGETSVQGLRRLSGRALRDAETLARRPRKLEHRQRLLAVAAWLRGGALGAAFVVPALLAVRLLAGGDGGAVAGAVAAAALGAAAGSGGRAMGPGQRGLLLALVGAAAGLAAAGWLA